MPCLIASALRATIVQQLGDPAPYGREMLVSEALRPAATTDRWQRRLGSADFAAAADRAMAGVRVIEAANVEEEALAIAVCLREAVETRTKLPRWSRLTVRSHAASWRRSNAGKSKSTIPAATRLPRHAPESSRGSWRKSHYKDWSRRHCWRCSSIRCCGLAPNPMHMPVR